MTAPERRNRETEPVGGWEAHRREQLRRWAALPLREQLAAVEEMGELGRKIQAAGEVDAESQPQRSAGHGEPGGDCAAERLQHLG
jgi:hypothetical protein